MLKNHELAELLAAEAENHEGHRQRALKGAARAAYTWPEQAADIVADGRSLRDLPKIGGWLNVIIKGWLEDPPELPERDPLRMGFLTYADALKVVDENPEWKEIRGDLQMHTEHSDGRLSVAEMASHCGRRGYDYIAITDHSKGLKIAGGMTEEELALQLKEIDGVNAALESGGEKFRVLKSLEMNINPEGDGDMEPESLRELDLVLGSFHSSLRKKEDQTDRYVAALKNPNFNVLGHPRCRMFNFRAGLSADWSRVFATAAETGKAIEINAHPNRQDLSVELLELAREEGCRFSIGTDAHAPNELEYIWIAVAAAILAGIPRERIINFMEREELVSWAKENRGG